MSIIENAIRRLNQNMEALRTNAAAPVHGMDRQQDASHSLSPIPLPDPPRASAAQRAAPMRYAEIDLERMHQLGMVVSNRDRTTLAEEFRIVKRPLLRNVMNNCTHGVDSGNPSNVVMVTSSVPGEGKTYCAINLAMSIATEKDYRVLLVDADVARPTIPKTLGILGGLGLMDILQDGGPDVSAVIIHTNLPSLSIITAGKSDRLATELLASQHMARLVTELAQRYPDRVVIFDSPPLLATTEAQVLASHMGQIVVVVAAECTTQNQLKEAMRILEGYPNVGLIYNKARRFATKAKYGNY